MWFLERGTGPIRFVQGVPHVRQNVFRGLDPVTGRPDVNPSRKPGTGKVAEFCPSHWGGKNWPPIAYSPQTRLVYVPANENLCASMEGLPVKYSPGSSFTGARNVMSIVPGADHIGEVQAWNVDTGARVWTHTFAKSSNWGPLMATGGGLVFGGGTSDRMFRAFDARTGKVLWEYPTNSGVIGRRRRSLSMDVSTWLSSRAGELTRAGCRTGSTPSALASSRRCRRAELCGCSR
jgi:alcohol dehydrogenase (cytochrome c)